MAREKGVLLDVHQSTAGGASLKQHWNSDKDLITRELIESGSFSMVWQYTHFLIDIDKRIFSIYLIYFNFF